MTFNNLCSSCTNIGCEFQSGIVRTKCTFYMPPHIEPDNCGNYDVISRQAALDLIADYDLSMGQVVKGIHALPPVKPQEPKTVQEKQAESEKYQKAFDDGYNNGYAQARFDYEQNPCDKCAMKNSNSNYCEDCTVAEYHGEKVDVPTKFVEQEPCDDVISRQAVLSKKIYTETENGWSGYTVDADYIENLPSVTQKLDNKYRKQAKRWKNKWLKSQKKTGHWLEKDDNLYECSECGQYIYSETEHDLLEFHAFCGRCGARMVEP